MYLRLNFEMALFDLVQKKELTVIAVMLFVVKSIIFKRGNEMEKFKCTLDMLFSFKNK